MDLGYSGNVNYSLTNNVTANTVSNNYRGGLNLSKYKEKKYSFRISGGPNYSSITSSLQNNNNNDGWGFNGNGNVNVYLPGKVEIGTDGNYEYKAGTETFSQDLSRFIWNAFISKKFLKGETSAFPCPAKTCSIKMLGLAGMRVLIWLHKTVTPPYKGTFYFCKLGFQQNGWRSCQIMLRI
jgi:hypothetical protein